MPTTRVNDADLFYVLEGDGPETVVLGHGYLMTHRVWDRTAAALVDGGYRVLRFDWRGLGQSEVTDEGYDPWNLAADVMALTRALGVDRYHYVGQAMGTYPGFRLGLRDAAALASLVLLGSSAEAEPPEAKRQYAVLLWAVRLLGFGAVEGKALPIIFGSEYLADPDRQSDFETVKRRIREQSRLGLFRSGTGIFGRDDILSEVHRIETPTLLITGSDDTPHPPEYARRAAERMPDARVEVVDGMGHTSPEEKPDEITRLLLDWLAAHPATP